MTKGFDEKIKKLKALEDKIAVLEKTKQDLRADIFGYFEKEKIGQYKLAGVATIARVERKQIKMSRPAEEIVAYLADHRLVKYLQVIPEQTIAEHKVLNKDFEKDIKEGTLEIDGVSVETSTSIMARFDK